MERDAIKEALDSVQPLLFERNYMEACRLMRDAFDTALAEGMPEDAATLSGILATYLSLAGDQAAAREAYARAEALEPTNPHHALAAAKHVFFQLRETSEAWLKVEQLLTQESDPLVIYKATILMGRFAFGEKDINRAAANLKKAHETAKRADLLPIWWDTYLARKLIDSVPEARVYLNDLMARARAVNDERVVSVVKEILEE